MDESAAARPVRETVLLLNGTFQAPSGRGARWWQPGSDFATKLDEQLAALGSPARCWAHTDEPFYWTGENDWKARSAAARQLAGVLAALKSEGWRCHVIAHSHGGNVFFEALGQLGLGIEDWSSGNHVLLGTPFLATYPPKTRGAVREEREAHVWNVLGVLIPLLLAAATFIYVHSSWICLILVSAVLLGTLFFSAIFGYANTMGLATARIMPEWKRFLLVNSAHDEAYQLLTKIVLQNPFRRKRMQFQTWRHAVGRSIREADRYRFPSTSPVSTVLLFATLVLAYLTALVDWQWLKCLFACAAVPWLVLVACFRSWRAAALLPFRAFHWVYSAVRGMLSEIAEMMGRRTAWFYIKQRAFGMAGQPAKIAAATLVPKEISEFTYTYEELPPDVVKRAHAKRSTTLSAKVAAVSEALGDPSVQLSDIDAVLSTLSGTASLVHSAYYEDEECICRCAKWISTTEAERSEDAEKHGIWF